jgi:hypothetical protein
MMAQKTGKLFFLLLFVTQIIYADPQVAIQITDASGYESQTIGVGIPFLITVEVSGDAGGASNPDLETYPIFSLQQAGTSSSISTINGRTAIKKQYRYQGRIDKEGTYTIGPARVQKNGSTFSSKSVELEITHKQDIPETREAAFLKIETPKSELFVGEKVPFVLRFYYANNDVRIEGINPPVFKGFKPSKLKGPQTGKEVIDGLVYRYQEWHCVLYPNESGDLVIPAVNAQVSVSVSKSKNAGDLFSFMDHMMGGRSHRQSMYSNALTLSVKPLPQNEVATVAVGRFTGLTAKVNLDKVAEGEGVVYTLELIGDGNFIMIGHPEIQVPEGLKFYDSNTHFSSLAANTFKKDFEYVIQGVDPGTYTIDSQEFTYFDTRQKAYRTLKSKPIKIVITPGTAVKPIFEQEEKSNTTQVVYDHDLEDAVYVTKWRFKVPRSLGWFWFFLLSLLPVVASIGLFLKRTWLSYQEKYAPHYGYKNAFNKARNAVRNCKKNGTTSQLYLICIDLFAARLKLPTSEISETRIERALEQGGMTQEKIYSWRLFFADITAESFASSESANKEQLCVVLLEWIIKFEKVL